MYIYAWHRPSKISIVSAAVTNISCLPVGRCSLNKEGPLLDSDVRLYWSLWGNCLCHLYWEVRGQGQPQSSSPAAGRGLDAVVQGHFCSVDTCWYGAVDLGPPFKGNLFNLYASLLPSSNQFSSTWPLCKHVIWKVGKGVKQDCWTFCECSYGAGF